MALVSLNGAVLPWPGVASYVSAAVSVSSSGTLDAAGEYAAAMYQAREAMTVSHVGFRPSTIAGSGTADIRIETVDTSTGLPTGTLFGTDTNIAGGALTSNTWSLQALTASASIAVGDAFAVKIAYNSGTSLQVARINNLLNSNIPSFVVFTGGSAAFSNTRPLIALGSSTTAFYTLPRTLPGLNIANNTFDNTSAARRGIRFRVPFPCRCVGISYWSNAAAGAFNAVLRSDAGAELSSSSTAWDGNISAGLTTASDQIFFDSPVTLAKDTWYRATIEPSEAVNCNITTLTTAGADYSEAVPGNLDNFHYTTYVTDTWTDSATTTIPIMDILIDQLDDGVGGGSGGGGVLIMNRRRR